MTLKELQDKMRHDSKYKAIIDPQDLHDGLCLVRIEALLKRINEALSCNPSLPGYEARAKQSLEAPIRSPSGQPGAQDSAQRPE